jgi:plastocyanin
VLSSTGPALRFGIPLVNVTEPFPRPRLPMDVDVNPARAADGRFARSRIGTLAFAVTVFATAIASIGATKETTGVARRRAVGRIEGTVEISASLTARRPQFRPYADPGAGLLPPAPPRDPIAAEVKNVVLYLDTDSAKRLVVPPPEGRPHASMAQRDERFVPHVLPVLQGTAVDFPNEDDVYHNVFSLSGPAGPNRRGFDLGRYPKGTSRSVTFSKPGIVQVFCHIHLDMSATILVLSNPFFASPNEDHRYTIDDVPEGDYTIVGWHERIAPITHRVHVVAGQTAIVDFNIPLPQGAK